uniref:Uncharacterized protein n=1 Tax=uncultured marine virus TaxID=186617 RepID=A0A0F7L310_9VIRU|nr:hypothetical protein [uncultured marine virus]
MFTPMVQFLSGCFIFFGPTYIGSLSSGDFQSGFLVRLMYILSDLLSMFTPWLYQSYD